MAYENPALKARNLQIIAVSPDTAAQGKAMAAKYDIDFPLLSDPDNRLAKLYAGVNDGGFPIPALFIIRRDGSVYFEKIGEAKDDRVDAAGLLAIVDKMQGGANLPSLRGYSQKWQARVGLAGGVLDQEDTQAAAGLDLTALYALGDYLAVGLQAGALAYPETRADMSLLLRARLPYWHRLGELYLQAPLGAGYQSDMDAADSVGLHHGFAFGTEFHGAPGNLLFAELSLERDRYGSEVGSAVTTTTLLLKLGYGWRF